MVKTDELVKQIHHAWRKIKDYVQPEWRQEPPHSWSW